MAFHYSAVIIILCHSHAEEYRHTPPYLLLATKSYNNSAVVARKDQFCTFSAHHHSK